MKQKYLYFYTQMKAQGCVLHDCYLITAKIWKQSKYSIKNILTDTQNWQIEANQNVIVEEYLVIWKAVLSVLLSEKSS